MAQSRLLLLRTLLAAVGLTLAGTPAGSAQPCGPFVDVALADPFCPSILEIYGLGLTAGTSPTTFGPSLSVTRQALAAILARATGSAGSGRWALRTALNQDWTTQGNQYDFGIGKTATGTAPQFTVSDGTDVWVTDYDSGTLTRVGARDGGVVWAATGLPEAVGVLSAMGKIFVGSQQAPGRVFEVDPLTAGVTPIATLGVAPGQMTFDGGRIWTANPSGSISILSPGAPWTVTTVGGFVEPWGIVFDGAHAWVTDHGAASISELNDDGSTALTVPVGAGPYLPAFDGVNLWVPSDSGSVTVVRASSGAIVATLTGNGLALPIAAAYDGQRILVTNLDGNSVSLWSAVDLAPLGSFPIGGPPIGACSDGIDFFVALNDGSLARF